MFVLTEERKVTWPVQVREAKDGKSNIHKFEAVFSVPNIDEAQDRLGDGRDQQRVREFLAEVLVDWSGVVDEKGNAIPCSEETKAVALSQINILEAIGTAFNQVLQGGRTKN